MTTDLLSELDTANQAVMSLIHQVIPNTALSQRVHTDAWSVKQIIAHLAHSHDFYMIIVTLAKNTQFGDVILSSSLAGWQQMRATDEHVLACTTSAATATIFQQTFLQLRAMLTSLTPKDLDQPFQMYEWQATTGHTTTLRQRVIQTATEHMYEHLAQIRSTLAVHQQA